MDVHSVSEKYPIGTKLRLANDDPGTVHEVYGHECCRDYANIIFTDGSKLSVERLGLIVEVVANVEYNVETTPTAGQAPYTYMFWQFYNSNHSNAKMECETVEEATKYQQRLCMIRNRKHLYSVTITRRKNVLYLIREMERKAE